MTEADILQISQVYSSLILVFLEFTRNRRDRRREPRRANERIEAKALPDMEF